MRLISWNVNGRIKGSLERQAGALAGRDPDVVCLQEVTQATNSAWIGRLARQGLSYSLTTVPLLGPGRRYANLVASRWPLTELASEGPELPWPEKLLSGLIGTPAGDLEVHVAHLPPGVSHPREKVVTFEAIYQRLGRSSERPRILCGDLNTPKEETATGDVVTWAGKHRDMFDRWDAAERSILQGLAIFDLADVYRGLHGYGTSEPTWVPRGRNTTPRRYDHVFASVGLDAVRCGYIHAFREARMSDHSPIEVDFAFDGRVTPV